MFLKSYLEKNLPLHESCVCVFFLFYQEKWDNFKGPYMNKDAKFIEEAKG